LILLAVLVAFAVAQPYYISISYPCTKNHTSGSLPDENFTIYKSGVCVYTQRFTALANGTVITEVFSAIGCTGSPIVTTASNPDGTCSYGSAAFVYTGTFSPANGQLVSYNYGDGSCGNWTSATVYVNGSYCLSTVKYACTSTSFTYSYCTSGTTCGTCQSGNNWDNHCNNYAPPPPQTPIPIPPYNPVAPVPVTTSAQFVCSGFVAPTGSPTAAPTTLAPTAAPTTLAPTSTRTPSAAGNPTGASNPVAPVAPVAPRAPVAPVPTNAVPNSGSIATFSALLVVFVMIASLF